MECKSGTKVLKVETIRHVSPKSKKHLKSQLQRSTSPKIIFSLQNINNMYFLDKISHHKRRKPHNLIHTTVIKVKPFSYIPLTGSGFRCCHAISSDRIAVQNIPNAALSTSCHKSSFTQTCFFFCRLTTASRCRFFQAGILPGKAHLKSLSQE